MDTDLLEELMLYDDPMHDAAADDACLFDSDDDMLMSEDDGDYTTPSTEHPEEHNAQEAMNPAKPTALMSIESSLQSLVESIVNNEPPTLRLLGPKRTHSAACPVRFVSFPGRTPEDAWKFNLAVALRVIELIHEAIISGFVTTKRDIYYKDPALFRNQNVVNRVVDDIARTFDVPRSALSVSAAAKGVAAGCFSIIHDDSTRLEGTSEQEGILIPELPPSDMIETTKARWILVIEKEAVFRSLICSDFWDDVVNEGIIVTGKGYPDINTRALVHRFVQSSLQMLYPIPVFALVDFDPDGVGIVSSYKHGSMTLAHENAFLTCPSMTWMGIRSKDIATLNDGAAHQNLLELSLRDRRKASKILERSHFDEASEDLDWRGELQVMLMLNIKAEIQALEPVKGISTLVPWLRSKLVHSE